MQHSSLLLSNSNLLIFVVILIYFLIGDAALLDAAKKGNLTRVGLYI